MQQQMTSRSPRSARKPLAASTALAALLCASFALAADATPIDRASEQVSSALTALKDVKVGNKDGDEHLEKARTYLARARAELLKAQGQHAQE
jgi:hypothetical protein